MQFNSLKDVILASLYVVIRIVALSLVFAIAHGIVHRRIVEHPIIAAFGWCLFLILFIRVWCYPLVLEIIDIDAALVKKDKERKK